MIPELDKLYWDLIGLRDVLRATLDRATEAIKAVERLGKIAEEVTKVEKEIKT